MQFVNYFRGSASLISRLMRAFEELGLSQTEIEGLVGTLEPLRVKGEPYLLTWEHSIRVGLLSKDVAWFMRQNPKDGLYPGLLHDVGKIQVPKNLLSKTDPWTPLDYRIMSRHVLDGFRILRDRFAFSAEAMLLHHTFQPNPYPNKLPSTGIRFGPATRTKIKLIGRIVSICDSFDSAHRVNSFSGELRALTGDEIKELMLGWHPDQRELISALYEAEIFTTYTEKPELLAV